MKLKELCQGAGIVCPNGCGATDITSIAMDSQAVRTGGMFICIRGLHTDGHTYIAEAVAAGACCIVTEQGASYQKIDGIIFLEAVNTRRASALLYHAWYGFPAKKLKMIGVTGTNGKTSVTHMLRAVLEASFCKCGLIGTVGCESAGRHLENRGHDALANMTTPDPPELYRMLAEMVSDGVEYVLMEVTSHALSLGKLEPLTFEAAVFTNLTPEHLDFHGTMENYADAKAELFQKSKLSVINIDDPYANRMIARASGRVVTCGIDGNADYTAAPIADTGTDGVIYHLHSERAVIRVVCPIPGKFTVMNSMQAAVVALELGFGTRAVKDALASLSGVRGRMERVKLGPGADFTVLIDYAHTPDALENLLRTALPLKKRGGRIVLLFGCGGDRDRTKRPVMGRIASLNADYVIVTSDNSRGEDPNNIICEILAGIDPQKPHAAIPDRAEAIRQAIMEARRGDVLLLAGKGHEEYEIDRTGRKPFLEREIVRSAFAERRRQENYTDSTETGL
ncbi:MAG: UDP-N-acetylmuramoyl-L-alanyl-D-glutamate--2,6-diaminopimelate ligase [Clostridia bacterium]|nr:UDP-N-acetylmuramoyl-L-alanyl-D-glutamate--2,6-diaminopimelate ligase [Clostridia bacterium]